MTERKTICKKDDKECKVRVKENILLLHSRTVPADQAYTKEDFKFRDKLRQIKGKVLEVEKEYDDHIQLRLPENLVEEITLYGNRKGRIVAIDIDKNFVQKINK